MTTTAPGAGPVLLDVSDLVPADVHQYLTQDLFEHYTAEGHLLVVTSDRTTIDLEPGDFIVKRPWSVTQVPYLYRRSQ